MYISIVKIKEELYKLENMTEKDRRVIAVVDSFEGCSDNWIKADLARSIVRYAGCEAWKIAMNEVYG